MADVTTMQAAARAVWRASLPSDIRARLAPLARRLTDRRPAGPPTAAFVNAVLAALDADTLSARHYEALRAEIRDDPELARRHEATLPVQRRLWPHKNVTAWPQRFADAASPLHASVDIFYVLPRVLRPTLAIETGVASGATSAILLAALHRNGHGELLSFDIPPVRGQADMSWTADETASVGFLVPDAWRDRWTLTLGDATLTLPPALEGRAVDYFFHDSDHSVAHMMFEYGLALKHLASGGLLVSDDITWHDAWGAFTKAARLPAFVNPRNPNIGVAVIPPVPAAP